MFGSANAKGNASEHYRLGEGWFPGLTSLFDPRETFVHEKARLIVLFSSLVEVSLLFRGSFRDDSLGVRREVGFVCGRSRLSRVEKSS